MEKSDMTKIDRLTKLEIVRLYREHHSVASIRKHFKEKGKNFTRQSIEYHVKQYKNGDFNSAALPVDNSVTPKFKVLTDTDLTIIKQCLQNNPTQSAEDIRKLLMSKGVTVCNTTVKKAIAASGFTCSSPRYCQMIRDANKVKRTDFCKTLINENDGLDIVVFTDETSVQLYHNKGICYHPKGSIPTHIPKPKHPLKVHVWAGISRRGPTHCIVFDGIMDAVFFTDKILEKKLLCFVRDVYPDGHRFQQDNDPKHTSRLAKQFMADNGINWWTWPAESPDFNPIEMVWSEMKREVAKKNPTTQAELINAIQDFWGTVTVDKCNAYIDHIYKVAPVCVVIGGRATGDIPSRLFSDRSSGRSFEHFQGLLEKGDYKERLKQLLGDHA